MSLWSYPVELLWPDFSAQVFPLPAEINMCTLSHQHHSSKPIFNTSLPLDCRESSAASLLLKPWIISQILELEGGIQGTGMLSPLWLWPPLCLPYLCLWAPVLWQYWWVSWNQERSAQSTLPACCQNSVPVLSCPSRSTPDGQVPLCLPLCFCLQSLLPSVFHSQFCLPGSPLLCFSPVRDTSEEGKETHLCQAIGVRNCLQLPGISILDKLIKTCPVWLQLNMSQERAGAILGKETAGVSPKRFQLRQPHFLSLVRRAVFFFNVEAKIFSRLLSLSITIWCFTPLNSTKQLYLLWENKLFAYHVDSWRWLPIHHHIHKYGDYPNLEQWKKSLKKRTLDSGSCWESFFIATIGIWFG